MCLHCIRATCDFLYRLSVTDQGKAVRRPRRDSTVTVLSSCSYGHSCTKVTNSTFLLVLSVKIAPKTKGGKGKRSKMDNVEPSQGGRTAVGLLQDHCFISVQF